MKLHYCPQEKTVLAYEGKCNWCGEEEGESIMFNPFKLYDEMLGLYLNVEDDEDVPMVTLEYTVPEELADELEKVILEWLSAKGIELDDEEEEDAG